MTLALRNSLLVAAVLLPFSALHADEVSLLVEDVPASGLVVAKVDLTGAARYCKRLPVAPEGIGAVRSADGQPVPLQFIPDADFDGQARVAGTLVLKLPRPEAARLRLAFAPGGAKAEPWNGKVTTPSYTVEHDPKRQGGFPWRIAFPQTGKRLETFRWNNRLHHRDLGSFCLCDDPEAKIERISAGPVCTVVRVHGRFVKAGKQAASEPSAVYDWYYFHDRPLVHVSAIVRQEKPFAWHEVHFLEMNYPGKTLPRWAGGEPMAEGEFKATLKSFPQSRWGAVYDGQSAIGMFACGQVLLHDGGEGTYLQAHGDAAWQEWQETRRDFSAWLWIGADPKPGAAIEAATKNLGAPARVAVSVDAISAKIQAVRKELQTAPPEQRQRDAWRVQGAEQLESQGRLEEAAQVAAGRKPPEWKILSAGDLCLILEQAADGLRVVSLFDAALNRRLIAEKLLPLFTLKLRHPSSDALVSLSADQGWKQVQAAPDSSGKGLELRWEKPADARLGDLRVIARAAPQEATGAIVWRIAVENAPDPWSVWRVVFPQVAVADLGPDGKVFFPKAAGEVQDGVWRGPFRFTGTYPSGWTTMQYLAAYDEPRKTGLYVAVHDPWGSTKDLLCESRPADHAAVMAFDHPVENMGLPGNRFELSGQAVWRLLRGDWFDAAVIYRDWVRKEAKWYPRLTAEGRADTPRWMRDLPVWALSSGTREQVVPGVKEFARFLGVPVGVHWYNWHQIPFDNDYPHYFPTKPGFADGVRELQSAGVFVMPYINGRLWDTRDKGGEDFEFTKVARPAVSKNEKGEPYVETYGSKEQDGSPVRLGVMCPTTEVWRKQVGGIVLRLMKEEGVKGVYIDQIAAAAPTLCFDKSHGHALGGGHWWTEGYWQLLETIRREKPADCMMTTECNGEPHIHVFDGYLTWHWQYDGQVPAFPAVYGGSIQMFGRSYGGGPTRDLALRMRAGQQLVFGEQLGWLGPDVVREIENAEFFRKVVQLRQRLTPYFTLGEMARPPRLLGAIPKIRADWQWNGPAWVTTDALLTGAWRQPSSKRLVLIFANVSDHPLTARLTYDLQAVGLDPRSVRITALTPGEKDAGQEATSIPDHDIPFPPRSVQAWEVTPR